MSLGDRLAALRSNPRVRRGAQWAVIALLVVAYLSLTHTVGGYRTDARKDHGTVRVVGSMLAEACGAASMRDLRQENLVRECRLARQGKIEQAVPDRALPAVGESPTPDTLPDTPGETIGRALGVHNGQVDAAVARWFRFHDLTLSKGYQRTLQGAVAASLAKNPPERGKAGRPPTDAEIAAAVNAALLADPPKDGVNGRGVSSAALDGCDIVFTYTDGTTDRIGPVCGPAGPKGDPGDPGSPGQTGPQGPKGDPGYPVSFTTADGQTCTDDDGDHRYECTQGVPPVP